MVGAVNRDFRLLFTAAAVSRLGTSVGYVAMPLVAVTALRRHARRRSACWQR